MVYTSFMDNNEVKIPLFEFLHIPRQMPEKRLTEERIQNFAAIYAKFHDHQASAQASRCIDCGTPYCSWQCPVHNHIPEWLKLVAKGQWILACELAHQTNTLPEICGRICPQDRLCEGACTLTPTVGAVTIGAIEQFLVEKALSLGWRPNLSSIEPSHARVAVVGAGPAGLACADVLVRHGVKVRVYDKYPEIGGLLTFGIPNFKLEKNIISRRRQLFEDMGVEFALNTKVGRDISFDFLRNNYDAVFLGLGADKSRWTLIPGHELENIVKPMPYLISIIEKLMGFSLTTEYDFKDKHVVVLGAGDTAMDCNRTAIRQGAKSVTCVYRQGEWDMPGSRKEVLHAKEEGVEFIWNHQAIAFNGKNSKVVSILLQETEKKTAGKVVLKANDSQELQADAVIVAYGFDANPPAWLIDSGVDCQPNYCVKIDEQGATNVAGLYAGGDMVLGANLVVNAISQGRQGAYGILQLI